MRGYASHIRLALMVKPFYADGCPDPPPEKYAIEKLVFLT